MPRAVTKRSRPNVSAAVNFDRRRVSLRKLEDVGGFLAEIPLPAKTLRHCDDIRCRSANHVDLAVVRPRLPERMLTVNGGAIVRRMFSDVALPPDVLAVYIRQITEPGAATAMLNWYRAIRLLSSRTLNLAQVIDVPTLVVWGDRDVALDPICLNGTERYVRDLTVKRLPGVSHWVQQDAPQVVNELLQEFLA